MSDLVNVDDKIFKCYMVLVYKFFRLHSFYPPEVSSSLILIILLTEKVCFQIHLTSFLITLFTETIVNVRTFFQPLPFIPASVTFTVPGGAPFPLFKLGLGWRSPSLDNSMGGGLLE